MFNLQPSPNRVFRLPSFLRILKEASSNSQFKLKRFLAIAISTWLLVDLAPVSSEVSCLKSNMLYENDKQSKIYFIQDEQVCTAKLKLDTSQVLSLQRLLIPVTP